MENQLIRGQVFDVLFNYAEKWGSICTESDCATVRDEICLRIDQSQFTADEAEDYINQEVEKRIKERMPSEEEVLRYFNNHFDCYADADHIEIAMTNTAVLKLIWWFRSRMSEPNNEGGDK